MIKDDEKFLFSELSKIPHVHARRFVQEINFNESRAYYILNKWSRKGIWEWGVSPLAGWFWDDLKEKDYAWFKELSGMDAEEWLNKIRKEWEQNGS